jgi:hypothetical protein
MKQNQVLKAFSMGLCERFGVCAPHLSLCKSCEDVSHKISPRSAKIRWRKCGMNLITAWTCGGLHVGLILKDCNVLLKTLIFMLSFGNIFVTETMYLI